MISIILPIYNASKYLRECLFSIKNQTLEDFEVICVNDGSSDNSFEICEEFAKDDTRFRLFNQKNSGVSSARNKALSHVRGDYVCFIDSDDIVDKDYLSNLYALIKGVDVSVIGYTRDPNKLGFSDNSIENIDSIKFIRDIINEAIVRPQIVCMLYRTSIIKSLELEFTLGCVRNEDTEFFIKYLSSCNFVNVSSYIGYYYRDNADSAVHKFNEKSLTFIEADIRISKWLVERNIYPSNNYIVSSSIQFFVYKTARQSNMVIYNKVHTLYDVKVEMRKMLTFPRLQRKVVALIYLLLGRRLFYNVISKI